MDESELTHLSILAFEAKTNLPIARMPVYAEVAVVVIDEPPVEIHESLREPARAALDPDDAVVEQAILEALAAVLTPASQDQLAHSPGQQAVHFIRRVIFDAVASHGGAPPIRFQRVSGKSGCAKPCATWQSRNIFPSFHPRRG